MLYFDSVQQQLEFILESDSTAMKRWLHSLKNKVFSCSPDCPAEEDNQTHEKEEIVAQS
jgi:hypothetical protein